MTYLENVSATEPWNALNEVDDIHPTKRLMIAITLKQVITQTDLAEWYGLSQEIIYHWLQ